MRLFKLALTRGAALGRRLRLQTIIWNFQPAFKTLSVGSCFHVFAGGFNGAQFNNISLDCGIVEIHREIGKRRIARIGHFGCDIRITVLLIDFTAYIDAQFLFTLIQNILQMMKLAVVQVFHV